MALWISWSHDALMRGEVTERRDKLEDRKLVKEKPSRAEEAS